MIQRTGEAGHGKVSFVQNNFYYDAFFLKAIGLSLINYILCVD
jgi:integrin alpha FG-GAP repeat containing protein 1